jgi:hypothetical protein
VYQSVLTRRTSVCAKDNDSLAPTAKWGLPFILECSELYELRPELYESLLGAGWLQETSGGPVKLRVVRLANLRLVAATALQYHENVVNRQSQTLCIECM